MRRKSGICLNPDRDYDLLKFIWRWKVVPTDILHKRFFRSSLLRTCYNRLAILRSSGYIDTVAIKDAACVAWTLRPKGFKSIIEFLPDDCDKGFKSESPNHDVMTLKLHLGDYVSDPLYDDLMFTEQELRRLSSVHYPGWVPYDLNRRPDGYIKSGSGPSGKAIAIEVEISPKSASEYETLGMEYAHCSQIERVIWAVPSKYIARNLSSIFSQHKSDSGAFHSIVLLDDVAKKSWASPVINGANLGSTIRHLLSPRLTSQKS